MKKAIAIWFLLCLLVSLIACGGNDKKEEELVDYEGLSQQFADALFEGRFDEAKGMALKGDEYVHEVSEGVDAFAPLYDKYEFQGAEIATTSAWGYTGNPEGDKRVQVTFQFREKGAENWKNGNLFLRALTAGGPWGIGDLQLKWPTQ